MGAARQLDDPVQSLLATAQAAATWAPDEAPETEEPLVIDEGWVTRGGRPRARTVSIKRLSKRALLRGMLENPVAITEAHPRPRTYGECLAQGLGTKDNPCPFASCKHHLYLDVRSATGSIKVNFPHQEPDELAETCSLEVATQGGITLEEVGERLNLTRERIRQLETRVLNKLLKRCYDAGLRAYLEECRDRSIGEPK